VFLLVPAHLGSSGQRAVKRLLLCVFVANSVACCLLSGFAQRPVFFSGTSSKLGRCGFLDFSKVGPLLFMVALWNRADHIYFHAVVCSFFFYSSPNLSRRRLDVCHTSTHGVALVRI